MLLSDEMLDKMAAPPDPAADAAKPPCGDPQPKAPESAAKAPEPAPAVTVPDGPVSMEQYVAKAPPEIKAVLERAVSRDARIKTDLVAKLTSNSRNKLTPEWLGLRTIEELEALVALAEVPADYTGQAGGPPASADAGDDQLVANVWDLTKKAEPQKKTA
jgi:hypothetical protein